MAWARRAPSGTSVPADELVRLLEGASEGEPPARDAQATVEAESPWTWRSKLWSAPSEARLGLPELREALGVSESWIYNRTRADADDRIPHAKIGGSLIFRAGELRAWIRTTESVEVAGPSDPPEGTLEVLDRRAS